MSNYNKSDDEEEYSDSSLPESDEELASLIRQRSMNGIPARTVGTNEDGLADPDESLLIPTSSERRELLERKKEMFENIVKIWFPKEVDVYSHDSLEDNELCEANEIEREAIISKYVEESYEQCNQFASAIGEQGMHCLLQNKDYRNGWNDFKRFVENIFRSYKYEVNFFHADSTNYWALIYDGNYDSLSMKKMGFFSLGPSAGVVERKYPECLLEDWRFPTEDTWTRTIRNSGYSHVTIVPVTYDVIPRTEDSKDQNDSPSSKTKPVWIKDPEYEVVDGAKSFKPLSVNGSKHVQVFLDQEKEDDVRAFSREETRSHTRLYKVIVNFVGQSKNPAWWNTKSKWELAEQNLSKNADAVSDIQGRLEKLNMVEGERKSKGGSSTPLDAETYRTRREIAHAKVADTPVQSTLTAISGTVSASNVQNKDAPKRKRSRGLGDRPERSGREKRRRKQKKENARVIEEPKSLASGLSIEDIDSYFSGGVANKGSMDHLDCETCFDLYVTYLLDVIAVRLSPAKSPRGEDLYTIGNFFSVYVLPDITNVDFKITVVKLTNPGCEETSAFTGAVITKETAYAIKCFKTADPKTILNAFLVENDKCESNFIVSFVKTVKYYKQMIDLRMMGSLNVSFRDATFVKHFIQMTKFKSFILGLCR